MANSRNAINSFASTRSVQIATLARRCPSTRRGSLPPHAPCRLQHHNLILTPRQLSLCLHTLRADCNQHRLWTDCDGCSLPPHAPCRLQRPIVLLSTEYMALPPHAPCRLQLTRLTMTFWQRSLCLHTLRADCNIANLGTVIQGALCLHTLRADCNPTQRRQFRRNGALPPHAPCRLQRFAHFNFIRTIDLCLHTLRADCNEAR